MAKTIVNLYTDEEIKLINEIAKLPHRTPERRNALKEFCKKFPHRKPGSIVGKIIYDRHVRERGGVKKEVSPKVSKPKQKSKSSELLVSKNELKFPFKDIEVDFINRQVVVKI